MHEKLLRQAGEFDIIIRYFIIMGMPPFLSIVDAPAFDMRDIDILSFSPPLARPNIPQFYSLHTTFMSST